MIPLPAGIGQTVALYHGTRRCWDNTAVIYKAPPAIWHLHSEQVRRVEHKPFRTLTLRLQHCEDGSGRDTEPTHGPWMLHPSRTALADCRLRQDERTPPVAPVVSLHNFAGFDGGEHIGILVV